VPVAKERATARATGTAAARERRVEKVPEKTKAKVGNGRIGLGAKARAPVGRVRTRTIDG
jgi:hypothetical protein